MEKSAASRLNIPYTLDRPPGYDATRFSSIWKVEATDDDRIDGRHGLSEPGLFITFDGAGRVGEPIAGRGKAADRVYRLTPGTLLFWDRGVPFEYRRETGGFWKFYFIRYSGVQMLRELGLECGKLYETRQTDHIVGLCELAIQMLTRRPIGYAYSADQAFRDILIKFAREREQSGMIGQKAISDVLAYIHGSIGSPLSMQQLADRAAMSRSKFFNLFKLATGLSPNAYILRLKLETARLALETTGQTVRAIAGSLGFSDEYFFSKTFRKTVGMPPAAYRRLHQCGKGSHN